MPSARPFIEAPMPPLAPRGLTCVGVDLTAAADAWHAAALPCISAGELAHARRFSARLDATRHLVGRALVRLLLARELGVAAVAGEFAVNRWGKPAAPDSGIDFSISHAGDAVWVALCRAAAVGIDVESAAAVPGPRDIAAAFHAAERAALSALDAPAARCATLRCWTRKEAIAKALGQGLSLPLADFRVRVDAGSADWLVEAPAGCDAAWTVADLPVPAGYHGSVAATSGGLSIACYALDGPGSMRPAW